MTIVKILSLLFVALIAGGWMMGSVLVVPAQKKLTASEYTAVEQANTSFGQRYFPIVVITSVILLAILLHLSRGNTGQMILIGCSLFLVVVALGFTRAKIVPINKQIDTWSIQNPPSNWQTTRNQWHRNHRIRTGLAVGAFILLSTAIVQTSVASNTTAQTTRAVTYRDISAKAKS